MAEWFIRPYDGHYSLALVCAYLGFDPEFWRFWVQRYLWNPHRRPAFWPGMRKLNGEDADTIRKLLRAGERTSVLAQQYRVDGSTIRKIRLRQRWKKSNRRSS